MLPAIESTSLDSWIILRIAKKLEMLVTLEQEGLSLYQAARALGVHFLHETNPVDKEVQANGLRFHYLDWGSEKNPTILLLHGALQQGHSWDFVALSLSDEYHIIALDARGHGETQWAPGGDYTVEAHQRDMEGVVKTLDLDPFILVGHSMGGRNAFVFASQHPELVRALAIVDTGPEVNLVGTTRIQNFRELPDMLDSHEEFVTRIQEYTGRSRSQVLGALKYSIKELPAGRWTWKYDRLLRQHGYKPQTWPSEKLWEYLGQIECPTIIIRGGDSDIFTPQVMDRMLETIPGSIGAVVPGARHLVPGDNPAGFLEALRRLLDGLKNG